MVGMVDDAAVAEDCGPPTAKEEVCGICLGDQTNPVNLPCGHSFCDGCLAGWKSPFGPKGNVNKTTKRRVCPLCRAPLPPSREMVSQLKSYRLELKKLKRLMTQPSHPCVAEYGLQFIMDEHSDVERRLEVLLDDIGEGWDGVTVLGNCNSSGTKLSKYMARAAVGNDIKTIVRWINPDRPGAKDRANAKLPEEDYAKPLLQMATSSERLHLMSILLQEGADVDGQDSTEATALKHNVGHCDRVRGFNNDTRLLLSWGASFEAAPGEGILPPRETYAAVAREAGNDELADLLQSELGGRRCEIVRLSSRPDLVGKTCVVDEYLADEDLLKVTVEGRKKEVLVLSADSLKRRDRTPEDCGYYIEFKDGRTIRHDFDSKEECQVFIARLRNGGNESTVTAEDEARAEKAAADLLAELGLDDGGVEQPPGQKTSKTKKKGRRGKKKK